MPASVATGTATKGTRTPDRLSSGCHARDRADTKGFPSLATWVYDARMGTRRTRAYWPTRIILAASIVGPPALWFWVVAMQPGTMFNTPPAAEVTMATTASAVGLWLAGVIWMIRIFRGPSDEPLPWRYRERSTVPGRRR